MEYSKFTNFQRSGHPSCELPSMQSVETSVVLHKMLRAVGSNNTVTIQVELDVLADQILLADKPDRMVCLRVIRDFPHDLVRQRTCLALLRALCQHKEIVNGAEIMREMEETVFPTVQDMGWDSLVSTWGCESLIQLAISLLPLNVDNNLSSPKCRILCQQLGSALFEWGSSLHGDLMPFIKQVIFPTQSCLDRVECAIQKLDLGGDKICNAKDFEDRVQSILSDLIPPANEEFTLSPLQNEQLESARNAMRSGLRLLSPELLQVSIYEKVHPLAECGLIDLIREFAQARIIMFLLDRTSHKEFSKFCAYYLMDSFDDVLRNSYPGGAVTSIANYMFLEIARLTFDRIRVDAKTFLRHLGEGQYCSEAVLASGAFFGLACFEDISTKFFSEMQKLVIDNRMDVEGMPIELGWADRDVGHAMWGLLTDDGRVRVINTGCGVTWNHKRDVSPNGAGNIYQLSRVSRVFDQTELRQYLVGTTNLLRTGHLANLARQINGTDEIMSKLNVALTLHYGSLGEETPDHNEIFTTGQKSITCSSEVLKGVVRSYYPERYNEFHIITKLLVFTKGYNHIKDDGHSSEFETALKRTLAKEVFYQLEGASKPTDLLREITLHLSNDPSWSWDCPHFYKSVYSCYQLDENFQEAKDWLDYVYQKNDLLGIQCTAESMDGYVSGELPLEAAADSLEILMDRMFSDLIKAYKSLEERSSKFKNFPWEDLVNQRRDLASRLLFQMTRSGCCLSTQTALNNLLKR